MKNLLIRKVKLIDSLHIKNLFLQLKHSLQEKIILKNIKTYKNSKKNIILVAEINKKILGCIAVQIIEAFHDPHPLARVVAIVVDENYRNKKIGSKLLKEAERHSKKIGCKEIELRSSFHWENAHIFYKKRAYKKNPKFYFLKKI